MKEQVDFYHQQAELALSDVPWFAQLQQNALADFTRLGFPLRHQENWKYTTVESFLQQRFTVDKINDAKQVQATDMPIKHAIPIINGTAVGISALSASLPAGVIVLPLRQALQEHAEKIKPYLGKILRQTHGFQALNTAMLHSGLFIYLPAGVRLEEPLLLAHWQDKPEQATYLRHVIIAETESYASIVEDYFGAPEQSYFTNTITEIHAAAGATINHYKIQRESKLAYHIGHLAVAQQENSHVNSHSFSVGGKLVRSDTSIDLCAPRAECLLNGIYAPQAGQHIDHHTVVSHSVPDCQSSQDYKGILMGRSRAVFNGKVIVAKNAQHSRAMQQNKNLLLSENAEINTKPQLEIFADDVVCTHGATVGQLDEEALFYLAARGIGRAEASRFLIQAFTVENLRMIPHVELAEWISHLLNQQLG